MTVSNYFIWVGMTTLSIFMLLGLGYWLRILMRKFLPNLKYQIKYKVFKTKYNEADVQKLFQYHDAGMSAEQVGNLIITNPTNKRSLSQIREILYIYSEIQKIIREVKT